MRMRSVFLVLAAVPFLGMCDCGGGRDVDDEAWRIRGTYRVAGYLCGETPVTAPAFLEWRIAPPNTYDWVFSDDGLRMEIRVTGESCTWRGSYAITYRSATRYSGSGSGTYTCTPSDAACHDFMMLTNEADLCGQLNVEAGPADHTAVPGVGGTLDVVFVDDTWCADNGHAGHITFRFDRLE